jgi:hypothetical protein
MAVPVAIGHPAIKFLGRRISLPFATDPEIYVHVPVKFAAGTDEFGN